MPHADEAEDVEEQTVVAVLVVAFGIFYFVNPLGLATGIFANSPAAQKAAANAQAAANKEATAAKEQENRGRGHHARWVCEGCGAYARA